MASEPAILLAPKTRFCSDPANASKHSDLMASPSFQGTLSVALLQYQYELLGGADPMMLAVMASRLKGAQDFVRVLLNLGRKEVASATPDDAALTPPEEALDQALGLKRKP